MRTAVAIVLGGFVLCGSAKAQTNVADISRRIIGTWQAAELSMPQPPPKMRQDIKAITFHTNGIVEWAEARRGKLVSMAGRYKIQPDSQSTRGLPTLSVSPTNYLNSKLSGICLLRLSELQIDVDSRFPVETFGKALKAVAADGRQLVFVRRRPAVKIAPPKPAPRGLDGLR